MIPNSAKPIEILLVEDDEADVLLTRKSLEKNKIAVNLNVVGDGEEALNYLKHNGKFEDKKTPDLIILDLNLPGMHGREVLTELKKDDQLKSIPVVVLSTSTAEEEILKTYNLGVNCYISKPINLEQFQNVVTSITHFWFSIVSLPPKD